MGKKDKLAAKRAKLDAKRKKLQDKLHGGTVAAVTEKQTKKEQKA